MSGPSYAKSLDALLRPLGFARDGNHWNRIRGDMWECVNLQISGVAGVTANMRAKDVKTAEILESIPCGETLCLHPVTIRIGQLIDRRDRWWKNNPDGPAEMTEAVRVYGLPWFDRVRSVEDQAAKWYGRFVDESPWRNTRLPELAITLYRLGEVEEALKLFEAPERKTTSPLLVAECRCVERWLKTKAHGAGEALP